jgi:hypothetical protein
VLLIGGAAATHAPAALAHIDLLEPEARAHGTAASGDTDIDANSNLKNAPCGQVTTGRSERVARYAPGQTIRVRVREENAHESYLRVSLDLDGDEFPLRAQFPGGPETQEEAAAAEAALGADGLLLVYREENDTAGFVHELEVTLPAQSCERCTLQVLQYMYDDPSAPYYFQCADLVIAAEGAPDGGAVVSDAGGSSTSGGASPGAGDDQEGSEPADPAAASDAPPRPAPAAAGSPGGVPSAGAAPSNDDAMEAGAPARGASSESGGCRLTPSSRQAWGASWATLLVGLALAGRRACRR